MAYKITEECINCVVCVDECEQGAIHYDESIDLHVIDPDKCDDCGSCAEVCPVDCCVPIEEE